MNLLPNPFWYLSSFLLLLSLIHLVCFVIDVLNNILLVSFLLLVILFLSLFYDNFSYFLTLCSSNFSCYKLFYLVTSFREFLSYLSISPSHPPICSFLFFYTHLVHMTSHLAKSISIFLPLYFLSQLLTIRYFFPPQWLGDHSTKCLQNILILNSFDKVSALQACYIISR